MALRRKLPAVLLEHFGTRKAFHLHVRRGVTDALNRLEGVRPGVLFLPDDGYEKFRAAISTLLTLRDAVARKRIG